VGENNHPIIQLDCEEEERTDELCKFPEWWWSWSEWRKLDYQGQQDKCCRNPRPQRETMMYFSTGGKMGSWVALAILGGLYWARERERERERECQSPPVDCKSSSAKPSWTKESLCYRIGFSSASRIQFKDRLLPLGRCLIRQAALLLLHITKPLTGYWVLRINLAQQHLNLWTYIQMDLSPHD